MGLSETESPSAQRADSIQVSGDNAKNRITGASPAMLKQWKRLCVASVKGFENVG